VRGLPAVFERDRRPWIEPDQATADEVVKVILRCPTGALYFDRKDGGDEEPVPDTNIIHINEHGPHYVRGNVLIKFSDGTTLKQETRLALCRCGASANKPFCDNSHLKIGFEATGELADNNSEMGDLNSSGTLEVHLALNGHIRLRGNFEIRGADGKPIFRASKASLCRCGGSKNKPFCDSTHRKIGFSSE
jgi:CDGSH-type Zn-finger protein